jgi:hypothetical protein
VACGCGLPRGPRRSGTAAGRLVEYQI